MTPASETDQRMSPGASSADQSMPPAGETPESMPPAEDDLERMETSPKTLALMDEIALEAHPTVVAATPGEIDRATHCLYSLLSKVFTIGPRGPKVQV